MKKLGNDRGFKNFSNRSFGGGNRNKSFGGNRGGFDRNRNDRRMYEAVCDKCGQNCQVPFIPTGEKPVYCSDCFEKTSGRDGGSDRSFGSGNRDFDGSKRRFEFRDTKDYQQENTRNELEMVNQKLDQILALLKTPKTTKSVKKAKKADLV